MLLALCAGLGLLLFGRCSDQARHGLLQSNAYDLGLFDQWAWLIGSGAAEISSMEHMHVTGRPRGLDALMACAALDPNNTASMILASQILALSCTALPVWWLAKQAGLGPRQSWHKMRKPLWLQPVVFNEALCLISTPKIKVMPAFALNMGRAQSRSRLWFGLLLLMLGCRDIGASGGTRHGHR